MAPYPSLLQPCSWLYRHPHSSCCNIWQRPIRAMLWEGWGLCRAGQSVHTSASASIYSTRLGVIPKPSIPPYSKESPWGLLGGFPSSLLHRSPPMQARAPAQTPAGQQAVEEPRKARQALAYLN